MKRLIPAALIGLCILLLTCSQAALGSASEALSLWWTRVLPALFPFYVLTSQLNRFGLLEKLQRLLRSPVAPCFLLGAIGGYPTGARVCKMLDRESDAVYCNLCSPMFLLGVVATGMCGNPSFFFPLAIAHYGSALAILSLRSLARRFAVSADSLRSASPHTTPASHAAENGGLLNDIASGMQTMLAVGGCIVFFYVPVNTLLGVAFHGRFPLFATVLVGLTELTSGCRHAVGLGLPTNVLCGMLAFFVSFGGLCVFAQAMLVASLKRPAEYLLYKAVQGFLAAIIAYFTTPLFLHTSVAVMCGTAEAYAQNALVGAAFLVSAGVGLTGCYLLALIVGRPATSRACT